MGEYIWQLSTVDRVVQATVVVGVLILLFATVAGARRLLRPTSASGYADIINLMVIIGGIVAIYVAYSTLRNQMQFSSEVALNEDAARIMEWERSNENIRCIYSWFDHKIGGAQSSQEEASDKCLAKNVANEERYTEAMLYIEESMFLLQRAKIGSERWGSKYAKDLDYWKADVSEDVTGLFSFHLLHRYPLDPKVSEEDSEKYLPLEAMSAAGIKMDRRDMCFRAYRVASCIEAAGREVEPATASTCADFRPDQSMEKRVSHIKRTCREWAHKAAKR